MHTLLFVAPILLSAMPGFVHAGQFVAEMLLCEQTYDVFIKGEIVAWYDLANKEGLIRNCLSQSGYGGMGWMMMKAGQMMKGRRRK